MEVNTEEVIEVALVTVRHELRDELRLLGHAQAEDADAERVVHARHYADLVEELLLVDRVARVGQHLRAHQSHKSFHLEFVTGNAHAIAGLKGMQQSRLSGKQTQKTSSTPLTLDKAIKQLLLLLIDINCPVYIRIQMHIHATQCANHEHLMNAKLKLRAR